MRHRIARWLFDPLLRLVLPGMGRRRKRGTATWTEQPPVTPYLHSRTARPAWERPLRGEDTALVRPYLRATGGVEVAA